MRNYKLEVDFVDVIIKMMQFDLIGYRSAFMTIFIEAADPDDSCYRLFHMIASSILEKDESIETRIFCRSLRKLIRIDRIQSL